MHAVIKSKPFLVNLLLPVALGVASSLLAGNMKAVYQSLVLPRFAPPAFLFGIVWPILYLLMGLAAYLIYTARGLGRSERRSALALYGFALLVNYLWSFLFFRFRLYTLGAWWIVLIFVVSALCAAVFYRIRKTAGLLFVPLLAWLVYAGAINFAVAALN